MEVQMRYIRRLLVELFKQKEDVMEIAEYACNAYNETVDSLPKKVARTHRGMSVRCCNDRGRVAFIMPFLNVEYLEKTKRADLDSYNQGRGMLSLRTAEDVR
jgi:hypothetical protein